MSAWGVWNAAGERLYLGGQASSARCALATLAPNEGQLGFFQLHNGAYDILNDPVAAFSQGQIVASPQCRDLRGIQFENLAARCEEVGVPAVVLKTLQDSHLNWLRECQLVREVRRAAVPAR